MTYPSNPDSARSTLRIRGWLGVHALLLPLGWLLTTAGYFGPWVAHPTAGLTLSGVDMAEFVKFLPAAQDGSLVLVRQLFYLPPVVVVTAVAFFAWSRTLGYVLPLRWLFLAGAVLLSLQLLPPAWSPASLLTAEFRLQTVSLVACWLLLALSWYLGGLPAWIGGGILATMAVSAAILTSWQFELVKPDIDTVYRHPPGVGWGFFLTLAGLVVLAVAATGLVFWAVRSDRKLWRSQ